MSDRETALVFPIVRQRWAANVPIASAQTLAFPFARHYAEPRGAGSDKRCSVTLRPC